jgi:hypothetical protein
LQFNLLLAKEEYISHVTETWARVYFNEETGGYLVIHRQRIAHSQISKNEKAKYDKEVAMCLVYARNGYRMVMLEEITGVSSPDVTINGIQADLKRVSGHNNIMKDAKKAVEKQQAQIVLCQCDKMDREILRKIEYLSTISDIHGLYFATGNEDTIIKF